MYRIILVGPGGSGKDYARNLLEQCGFHYCPVYTTRPMRENEINGKDYFFIAEKYFKKIERHNKFYTCNKWLVENNYWYYGLSKDLFNDHKYDLFIMTPLDIKQLSEKDKNDSIIIYLNIDENIRRERLSKRNDKDSVERRIISDRKDFENFDTYNIKIDNNDFNTADLIEYLYEYVNN